MNETDTLERVELVVDLDDVLRCNHPRGCDRPAEWVYHCRVCGRPWLGCTPHKKYQDEFLRLCERAGLALLLICDRETCPTQLPIPVPWTRL